LQRSANLPRQAQKNETLNQHEANRKLRGGPGFRITVNQTDGMTQQAQLFTRTDLNQFGENTQHALDIEKCNC
jgi:hypothetical protein